MELNSAIRVEFDLVDLFTMHKFFVWRQGKERSSAIILESTKFFIYGKTPFRILDSLETKIGFLIAKTEVVKV